MHWQLWIALYNNSHNECTRIVTLQRVYFYIWRLLIALLVLSRSWEWMHQCFQSFSTGINTIKYDFKGRYDSQNYRQEILFTISSVLHKWGCLYCGFDTTLTVKILIMYWANFSCVVFWNGKEGLKQFRNYWRKKMEKNKHRS